MPQPSRSVTKPHGHVVGRAGVEVPSLLQLDVAVAAADVEEDVRRWLMKMKATIKQLRRGVDVDLTDPCHQQRLLIVLVSEVRLLLHWCTTLLRLVPFLAAVVVVLAAAPTAAGASIASPPLLQIVWPVIAAAFAGARLGAALAGLHVLHPRLPLLLSVQQFAARTCGRIGFFIRSSFNRP
jgi:hypothetical protein